MRIARALLAVFLLVPLSCAAQSATWSKPPVITILGREGDPRIALVHEAVDYWNGVFAEVGSPFRFGTIQLTQAEIPVDTLRALSDSVVGSGGRRVPMPGSVAAVPGNLVVALSDGDFISFAVRWPDAEKALAAIKSHLVAPFRLPNVARNVIAHEIGHAIGRDSRGNVRHARPRWCRRRPARSRSA